MMTGAEYERITRMRDAARNRGDYLTVARCETLLREVTR